MLPIDSVWLRGARSIVSWIGILLVASGFPLVAVGCVERNGDTVWVMKDGKLQIRETEIVFRDIEFAYIRKGLESGDEVVITTLATVAEGVGLRKDDITSSDGSSSDDTAGPEAAAE